MGRGDGPAPRPPLIHQDAVVAVAFSPDGKTVAHREQGQDGAAVGSSDRPAAGAPLDSSGPGSGRGVQPGQQDRADRQHQDRTARLWDATTGRPLGLPMIHQGALQAVAFSPDGKTVLTGSTDKTARLWDAATGRPFGLPMTHQGAVWAVAFSPDGKTVLTGSEDRTARLWDAATGRPLGLPMTSSWPGLAVAFSPDGKTVLTGSWDRTARLWDAATGRPLGPP